MMDPFWPMSEEELGQQEEVELKASKHEAEVSETTEEKFGLPPNENNNEPSSNCRRPSGERRVRFDSDRVTMQQISPANDNDDEDHVRQMGNGVEPSHVLLVSNDHTSSYTSGATLVTLDHNGQDQVIQSPEWLQMEGQTGQLVALQQGWLIPATDDHVTQQQPALVHTGQGVYDVSQGFSIQTVPEVQEEYVLYVTEPTEEPVEEKRSSGWCC